MDCKRCGADEDRIHGYCSVRCEELHDLEADLTERDARMAPLEAVADAARPVMDWQDNGVHFHRSIEMLNKLRTALAKLDKEKQEDGDE